jgi:hypothetical protein
MASRNRAPRFTQPALERQYRLLDSSFLVGARAVPLILPSAPRQPASARSARDARTELGEIVLRERFNNDNEAAALAAGQRVGARKEVPQLARLQ